jgi:hypothetical protein
MAHFEDAEEWPRIEQEARAACETLVALEASFLLLIDDVYTDLFTAEPTRSPSTRLEQGFVHEVAEEPAAGHGTACDAGHERTAVLVVHPSQQRSVLMLSPRSRPPIAICVSWLLAGSWRYDVDRHPDGCERQRQPPPEP